MDERYLWSAKGALSLEAWGTAPGMASAAENKALKARSIGWSIHRSLAVNRAFSAVTYLDNTKPGARPQATGDLRLWR